MNSNILFLSLIIYNNYGEIIKTSKAFEYLKTNSQSRSVYTKSMGHGFCGEQK